MSKRYLLALYNDIDEAEAVITELRMIDLKGFDAIDDLSIQSPVGLPEAEKLLVEKPVNVQWYTLVGSTLCAFLSFWLIAGSQANFFSQLKGGKPIVPIPPDLVLTYEMFILGGIFLTVVGFLIGAGLPAKRSMLYSSNVTEDQVGVLVKADEAAIATLRAIFIKHHAVEIQEQMES